jgi:hypothetical protein
MLIDKGWNPHHHDPVSCHVVDCAHLRVDGLCDHLVELIQHECEVDGGCGFGDRGRAWDIGVQDRHLDFGSTLMIFDTTKAFSAELLVEVLSLEPGETKNGGVRPRERDPAEFAPRGCLHFSEALLRNTQALVLSVEDATPILGLFLIASRSSPLIPMARIVVLSGVGEALPGVGP